MEDIERAKVIDYAVAAGFTGLMVDVLITTVVNLHPEHFVAAMKKTIEAFNVQAGRYVPVDSEDLGDEVKERIIIKANAHLEKVQETVDRLKESKEKRDGVYK